MRTLGLKFILIVLISFISYSCKSDDDSTGIACPKVNNTHPLLLGDWNFSGTYIDGDLFLEECDLLTTLKVTCDLFETTSFGGNNCSNSETYSSNYRIEGNSLISLDEEGNDVGIQHIIILNETTLILQNDFSVLDNITENWERQ
ncbi:lipocalin family protein [Psychroserpens sp.]|uniref:lipocalin family protein n=1 Tax=Psychroserpens sp. TaxID=2020870 RepID=UPI002B277316|nr:lipocalin family protein [Psychroserpens sp.]